MTLRQAQAKFEYMEAQLVIKAVSMKTPLVRLEWMRSVETQRQYVARGASKTMNSMHIQGLASDFAFLDDIQDDGTINYDVEKYRALGEFWESLGGRWGGRFGDDPNTVKIEGWDAGHFELAYKGV